MELHSDSFIHTMFIDLVLNSLSNENSPRRFIYSVLDCNTLGEKERFLFLTHVIK